MLFEIDCVAVLCLFHKRLNNVRSWKNIILDLKGNLFRLNGKKKCMYVEGKRDFHGAEF